MAHRPSIRSGRLRSSLAVGAVAMLGTTLWLSGSSSTRARGASAATPIAGSAGIVTNVQFPLTTSAQTYSGRGTQFGNLKVTVNQTGDLVNQALFVTWTGGAPTFTAEATGTFTGSYSGNYLQIFQCWGNDDGSVPSNPGPAPEHCEFGGEAQGGYPVISALRAYTRIISSPGWGCGSGAGLGQFSGCQTYPQLQQVASAHPDKAYLDASGDIYDPFVAVDGTNIPKSVNPECCNGPPPWTSFDINPYFSLNTSNEVDFARTYPDGTGESLFTADTGLEAPGLGCGQQVEAQPDGSTVVPKCWLVVVPRSAPELENQSGYSIPAVFESPLTPGIWQNRISIPLTFQSIGTSCQLGASVRRIVGGEMAARAVGNWQPALCLKSGVSPFSYAAIGDDNARSQLLTSGPGLGMAIVSRPIDPTTVDPTNPLVYAPISLSGVVVGFNIQRVPATKNGQYLPDELPLAGSNVAELMLTPRLVAKLLTESYRSEFYPGAPGSYTWVAHNPVSLVTDPDFLAFNPEFTELVTRYNIDTSQLILEQPSSDAAYELWQWILADPEAKAWLDGQPDTYGMNVNPFYSTSASVNPSGVGFATQPVSDFPKSDPYCFVPGVQYIVGTSGQEARNLCFQDWSPFTLSMKDSASAAAAANSGAKTQFNLGATDPSSAWTANGPQGIGEHFVLAITTSDQAAQHGLQVASLSQAGDDGASRTFVAPDPNGILAGEAAMVPSGVTGVLVPNPATRATGAYPLSMVSYAAVAPVGLDAAARGDYSAFVRFAAGDGQQVGTTFGTLPIGYVALPSALATESTQAASTIADPTALEPTTTTTSPPTTTTSVPPATSTIAPATTTQTTAAPPTPSARATPPSAATPTGATTAPSASPSTITSVSARRATTPVVPLPAASPIVSRTPGLHVGPVRFALLIGLAVGLAATAASFLLGGARQWFRPTAP